MNATKIQNDTSTIPSRFGNPFATCWTRPGAIPFVFAEGQSAESLAARFAFLGWRAQILGPHGSGKSTLLAALRPIVAAANHAVEIVDGFEECSRWTRWRVRAACRVRGQGLLVTAHRSVGLPTLIELCPNGAIVRTIVAQLRANAPTPVGDDEIAAGIARHGANVREILFDLFNCHETLVRGTSHRPDQEFLRRTPRRAGPAVGSLRSWS